MRLEISKKNKRYFEYKGKILPLMGSGLGQDLPRGRMLRDLQEIGVNQYLWLILPSQGRSHPYKMGPGAGVDNNWGGFDRAYWKKLQDYAADLEKKNSTLFVFVFSTCVRKRGKGTWATHLWNAENGGPISAANGVFPFYERGSENFIFGKKPYKSLNSWKEKSQYRQEQLLAEVADTLKKFRNTAIILVWEIYAGLYDSKIGGAKDWACHMVRFINSLSDIPLGIGTWFASQVEYVIKKTGIDIFGFMEGSVPTFPVMHGRKRDDLLHIGEYPIVVDGWQAQLPDTRYSILRKTRKCKYFLPGMEKENITNICTHIVKSIQMGANISLPFDFWWNKITRYVTKDCGEQFPQVRKLDMKFVRAEIFKFMIRLKNELAAVDWSEEPGNKITDRWCEDLIPTFGAEPVKKPPVAVFTYSPKGGNPPLRVNFDASKSYDPDGTISGYQWDFGDGHTGEGKTVGHSFTEAKAYAVTLTVFDRDGLKGTAKASLTLPEPGEEQEWQVIKKVESRDGVVIKIRKRSDERQFRIVIKCPDDKNPDEVPCFKLIKDSIGSILGLIDCFAKSGT